VTAADLDPGKVYSLADAAALFGVCPWTVRQWARAGRLPSLPRAGERGRYRFLGLSLLRLLGDEVKALPAPSETKAELEARGKAALERIQRRRCRAGGG